MINIIIVDNFVIFKGIWKMMLLIIDILWNIKEGGNRCRVIKKEKYY